ncbi:MAG: M1 family metallopeptidase [Phycisphaera sp.]|nr:M1 family metallopeptidase [Phycisphaera sp.]
MLNRVVICGLGGVLVASASAQSGYAVSDSIFAPIPWPDHGLVRTASGAPGPNYWQQRADYEIDVTLDEESKRLEGSMRCTYTNNSPDELRYLWLNLEQNAFRPDSIGTLSMMPDLWWRVPSDFVGGFDLGDAAIDGEMVEVKVYDAMGKVNLPEPLAPGQSVVFELEFAMPIPPSGRLGIYESEAGMVFQLAHWFPNVAVYDDVNGWSILPHQGDGEFYTNYGDYTVNITVPSDHLVAATGELMNAADVLTDEMQDRLAHAKASTEKVSIRSLDEIPSVRGEGTSTWTFKAEDVRAFAFASSRAFAWDAAIAAEDRPVLCQTFYPPEAAPLWSDEAVAMGQHTINFYSEWLYEYPYPSATNVNGVVGGMEYPMIVFCSEQRSRNELVGVTDHEFGHEWFPMIVNSDERRYGWMDEGFNTFINYYSYGDYLNESTRGTQDLAYTTAKALASDPGQPIMTFPDRIADGDLGFLVYGKPGYGMQLLRDVILGPDRFDEAFGEYIRRWAFKSPKPEDFFRTMEDAAGADLAWFWRGWFYEAAALDQAIGSVTAKPRRGRVGVEINNLRRMVMPVDMLVTYDDGSTERRRIPVEAWARTDSFPTRWDSGGKSITRIELDPDKWLPDVDRSNNVFEADGGEEDEPARDRLDHRNVPSSQGESGSVKKSDD